MVFRKISKIKNNENFSPLPLGLENKGILKMVEQNIFNLDIKKYSVKKQSTVLCSFATQTNKIERQKVYDIAQTLNFCEIKLFKKEMITLNICQVTNSTYVYWRRVRHS